MKRRPPRDPILLEVAAAIGAGRIRVTRLGTDGEVIHGLTYQDGRICIDPSPDVVDTAIHECLHRLRPAWSERTVRARTGRLMRELTRPEMDKLYELVAVAAKRRSRRTT